MHILAARGLHDLTDERFNVYGQVSLIGHYKAPFSASYTNLGGSTKSLLPTAEGSWTATLTLFAGVRLWRGAELYFVPELLSSRALSGLAGLGSTIHNAELQKTGGAAPTPYVARAYLRQTIRLCGGEPVERGSDAMQLGATTTTHRLVLIAGRFSIIDFFDKNSFAGDLRKQFINMAFMTHAAWDFAADARGYTWGAAAELYWDDWAFRVAHTVVPLNPNDLAVDPRFWRYFSDQLEIEHNHTLFGRRGATRIVGYVNRANMARFEDAMAAYAGDPQKNAAACVRYNYGSQNRAAPDLCWARRPNLKAGIGVNVEQDVGNGIGLFLRAMFSDGQTEVYAFTSTDRSISFGALAKGALWRRPTDALGVGVGAGWISSAHAEYLRRGGIDGFIGDGTIKPAVESVVEVFYSVNPFPSLWITADYQHVTHPAYNADRGPVNIVGGRLHTEF